MSQVSVFLAPVDLLGAFYTQDQAQVATDNIHRYTEVASLTTWMAGPDAAEELFDLSNNPSRQDERARCYGNHRSVSVGDVVDVDGKLYLCASVGWTALN